MVKRYSYIDIQRAHVNGDELPSYMVDAALYDELEEALKRIATGEHSRAEAAKLASDTLRESGAKP